MRWFSILWFSLIALLSTCPVAMARKTPLLSWQAGQLKSVQHVLKTDFTVSYVYKSWQGSQIEKPPGVFVKPLHITARPGQVLIACSHRVTACSEGEVIEPELSIQGNLSKIVVADWHTTLDLAVPYSCP